MKIIRVFVSSPGDVKAERSIADRLIRATAEEFGIPVSVQYSNLLREERLTLSPDVDPRDNELVLCPYFWEYQRFSSDLGYQDQIPNTAQFDLVICILWSRLGTKLHPRFRMPDDREPRSGTEYELGWAREQHKKTPGIPVLQVYRNRSRPNPPVDAPEKLEEFLKQSVKQPVGVCRALMDSVTVRYALVGRGSRITARMRGAANFLTPSRAARTIPAPSRGLAVGSGSARLSV